MKVFINADIEGIAGITHWDEASNNKPEYHEFRERMTQEVIAACDGALNANATEIYIKDAHGSGRNIIASQLPECARLIRGWSGHPFCMVQELYSWIKRIYPVFLNSMTGYHRVCTWFQSWDFASAPIVSQRASWMKCAPGGRIDMARYFTGNRMSHRSNR